jgi:hypothetical protein
MEEASLLRLERAARVLFFSLFLVVEEEESFLAMGVQLVKNYQKSFSFFLLLTLKHYIFSLSVDGKRTAAEIV